MMREPWFWRSQSGTARLITSALTAFSFAYNAAQQARRRLTTPFSPDIPVICIGNASLGGEGKTPFAIMLSGLLEQEGLKPCFLTRGYGGRLPGPVLVDPARHSAADVGDEALLLAARAPTWLARNRVDGAEAAAASDADIILMDDGFQNPTLKKTYSILLYSGAATLGNGRVFPAGPLREPVAEALTRAQLIILSGDATPPEENDGAEVLRAYLEPVNAPAPQKVVAFSGIGKPSKFFNSLSSLGFEIADRIDFPDHHFFTPSEINALRRRANESEAALITTEKDFVRLSDDMRENILTLPVTMRIDKPEILRTHILQAVGRGDR